MSLRAKLALVTFAAAAAAFTPAAYMLLDASAAKERDGARARLTAAAGSLKTLIEQRFRNIRKNLAHTAEGLTAKNAVREFEEAAFALAPTLGEAMEKAREAYVDKNPHPKDARALLARGPDGSLYDMVHEARHPRFYGFMKKEGLADIFLVEPEERFVVYSARKGEKFGRRALGAGAEAGLLGKAAAGALRGGGGVFHGFAPHEDAGSAWSAFIASPVTDGGAPLGVLAARLEAETVIGEILRSGLWPGGGLFAEVTGRNGDRLAATDGPRPGGVEWMTSRAPLEIDGMELSVSVAAPAPAWASRTETAVKSVMTAAAPAALIAIVIYIVLSRLVSARLEKTAETLRAMAGAGADLASIPPPGVGGEDETGRLAALLEDARRSLADRILELESRVRSLTRYIESLSTAPPWRSGKGETAGEEVENLVRLYESEAERLAQTIRRQRKEIEALKGELEELKTAASGQDAEMEEKKGEVRPPMPPPSQGRLPGF